MLKALSAVGSLAAVVAVSACVPGTLSGGGGGYDAGTSCPGTLVPERCYRSCDGSTAALIDGSTCPEGYIYSSAHCAHTTIELIANTCGADAAGGAADASDGGAGGSAGESGGAGTSGAAGIGGAAGRGGAAGGGPGCTDLVNDAPPAIQRFHMEDRPATELGVGGQLADGVYDLSVIDYYVTSLPPADWRAPAITSTVRISNAGTRMEAVTWYEQGNVVTAEARTLAPAGTQVTETWTCPIWGPNTEGYSATPDRFMLSNPMTVNRYVRRADLTPP